MVRGKPYIPALGPKLKFLLAIIFGLVALLGATGAYLSKITYYNRYRAPNNYTNTFTFWVFLAHVGVGVLAILPFFFFGSYHLVTAWKRPNRVAVRLGVVLLIVGGLVCLTGLALIQISGLPQLSTGSLTRTIVYWLHIILPIASIFVYMAHRKAGPAIKWKWGYAWAGSTLAFVAVMIVLHGMDPRDWYREGPKEGITYYHPSDARTATGDFIPAEVLMMDEYCLKCHAEIYRDHLHSAHKFSSFNNPAYLHSVRETREVSLKRDGNVKASRWCAGCHDPVPFFSGAFDDPKFDDVQHPTAHAGITCTVCHAITNVNSTIGNAAYTIEEPEHYPFAFSKNDTLQWVNNQLIKAKPDFHKKTFLKPFHKTEEFCSTCHKVGLPVALNHYKDFLRGQNHYDTYLLSGVSGHGARAFYYPPQAKTNCAECHMPLKESNDFAAKDFDGSGMRKIHNHFFPAANTGLPFLLTREERYADRKEGFLAAIQQNVDYLRDNKLRIDLFGLKEGGSTRTDRLIAPLRPQIPTLKPGQKYLVEVVVRTLNVGHPFSQGTVDSNEIWVDFEAISEGKVIARNGALKNSDESGPVDEWSHFINVHMLDRNGNRINRRNPQDIFTPLYDHQIPPGAANVIHYRLDVPTDIKGPIELRVRLRYRKFDYEYMEIVHRGKEVPKLPIVDMCEDKLTLPVEGFPLPAELKQESPIKPAWQRWNDYGIANLIEGGVGNKRGHRLQAAEAFKKVLALGVKDAEGIAHLNLARVYVEDSNWIEAARELELAKKSDPPAPWWTVAFFQAEVNAVNASRREDYDAVIADLERVLDPKVQPRERKFDFTKDYVVINTLANRLFKRSLLEEPGSTEERKFLLRAIEQAERVLQLESEDVEAHDLLTRIYARLGSEIRIANEPGSTDFETLAKLARSLGQPGADRLAAVTQLVQGILTLNQSAASPNVPKLTILRDLLAQVRPLFHAETDREKQNQLAVVLAALHRVSHSIFKIDENARGEATRLYREKNPVARYAARDRVIYPTTPEQRQRILQEGGLAEE
jgi:tetratricopeptide (TPR) repeat protein